MVNVIYKKQKTLKAMLILLAIVGLVVSIICVSSIAKTISFNNNSEVIEVYVESLEKINEETNGKDKYQVFVDYSYNGKSYSHVLLSGLNESRSIGDRLKANINLNNNEDIRYMNKTTFGIILGLVLGLAAVGCGVYFFGLTIHNENAYKDIIKDGRCIKTTVTRVYPDGNVYNGKNQYLILDCEWTEKHFTSLPFKNCKDICEGDIVPVYYTSLQKSKYFVDVANVEFNKENHKDNWTFK